MAESKSRCDVACLLLENLFICFYVINMDCLSPFFYCLFRLTLSLRLSSQELQCLEQTNSAFQKEIAALKKELRLYETALERHECRLSTSASSSPAQLPVASSAKCASSSLPQASNSPLPSRSTSLNPIMGRQTFNYREKPCLSSLAASSAASSSSPGSSPPVIPNNVSFSTRPAPHSLFSQLPQVTSRPTNVTPVRAKPAPGAAARLQSETIHEDSRSSCFMRDRFLTKRDSSLAASAGTPAPFPHVEAKTAGVQTQECSTNAPQLYSRTFSGNPNSPRPPCSLLPPPPRTLQPSPAPPFVWKQSYCEQVSASSESLLSLLTVPSPLTVCQTTSSGFHGPLLSSQPEPEDPSLSELLEINDWILNGLNSD